MGVLDIFKNLANTAFNLIGNDDDSPLTPSGREALEGSKTAFKTLNSLVGGTSAPPKSTPATRGEARAQVSAMTSSLEQSAKMIPEEHDEAIHKGDYSHSSNPEFARQLYENHKELSTHSIATNEAFRAASTQIKDWLQGIKKAWAGEITYSDVKHPKMFQTHTESIQVTGSLTEQTRSVGSWQWDGAQMDIRMNTGPDPYSITGVSWSASGQDETTVQAAMVAGQSGTLTIRSLDSNTAAAEFSAFPGVPAEIALIQTRGIEPSSDNNVVISGTFRRRAVAGIQKVFPEAQATEEGWNVDVSATYVGAVLIFNGEVGVGRNSYTVDHSITLSALFPKAEGVALCEADSSMAECIVGDPLEIGYAIELEPGQTAAIVWIPTSGTLKTQSDADTGPENPQSADFVNGRASTVVRGGQTPSGPTIQFYVSLSSASMSSAFNEGLPSGQLGGVSAPLMYETQFGDGILTSTRSNNCLPAVYQMNEGDSYEVWDSGATGVYGIRLEKRVAYDPNLKRNVSKFGFTVADVYTRLDGRFYDLIRRKLTFLNSSQDKVLFQSDSLSKNGVKYNGGQIIDMIARYIDSEEFKHALATIVLS